MRCQSALVPGFLAAMLLCGGCGPSERRCTMCRAISFNGQPLPGRGDHLCRGGWPGLGAGPDQGRALHAEGHGRQENRPHWRDEGKALDGARDAFGGPAPEDYLPVRYNTQSTLQADANPASRPETRWAFGCFFPRFLIRGRWYCSGPVPPHLSQICKRRRYVVVLKQWQYPSTLSCPIDGSASGVLMNWAPDDPSLTRSLATKQLPGETWLPKALAACRRCRWESRAYAYFVDGSNPNQQGSDWQFVKNLRLSDPKEGAIILDVLVGNRIGGVEFVDRL